MVIHDGSSNDTLPVDTQFYLIVGNLSDFRPQRQAPQCLETTESFMMDAEPAAHSQLLAKCWRKCPMPTHEVQNQVPPLVGYNLFSSDRVLVEASQREGAAWIVDQAH